MKEERSSFDRDLTKGSIFGNLFSLAWPMMVTNSIMMVGPTIDMIWVGRLGPVSIAGVGVGGMAVMMVSSAMMGLGMGARAMIARFIGSDELEGANHVVQQAFVISVTFSIVIASIGIFFAEAILVLLGVEADVVAEGATYMRILFVGSMFMSFGMIAFGAMMASGDAVTPMKITAGTRIFHVVLCPFLIFGWWIFPRLGVSGAALTNVISQSIGLAIGLWILFSGRTRLRPTLRNFRLDPDTIWRMVKIGIPASINMMQRSFVGMVMLKFIIAFGTLAVAAHTVGQRVEMLLFMPSAGFGQAAGVLAGQNLGAGQPERAERSGWLASGLVTAIMVACSIAAVLWAESIISIFSTEPGLVEIASTFLRIAAVGYLVLGVAAVLTDCLNGVGDTLIPLLASLTSMWGVQLPLAYFLPRVGNLGVYGVRWAMVAALAARTLTYIVYFRMGRWKRKEV